MDFPDDENGDVLRRIHAEGKDLQKSRIIDFTVVFPDQGSAETFAAQLSPFGNTISVEKANVREEFPWDVLVSKFMIPAHQEIGDCESFLDELAAKFGGHNDGWGNLSQP